MKRFIPFLVVLSAFLISIPVFSQQDTSINLNQDAIYNRPFIKLGKTKTALGGYVEGNTNYFSEDGVSEGFSMELRRFNIFLYSQLGNRIRFLSELEFEHGTEEIALETALLDFEVNQALNFRAGVLLPAIGIVNTNHDSPNWEFVERPISSTAIIPTTLSEVGFGVHGKFYPNEKTVLSYDAYLVNGLQDGVILNAEGKTSLESGKTGELLAEDNNGKPMFNARVSASNRNIGEIGLAYYGGVYNSYVLEGEEVDEKRKLHVLALDFSLQHKQLNVRGEAVWAKIDVPEAINEIYGESQFGGFIDAVYPIWKTPLKRMENSVLNAALRLEYADLNRGDFTTNTTSKKGDENLGMAFGLSLRPRPGTVLRVNYRYHFVTDVLNNPAARVAGFQVGVASYF